MVLVLEGAGYEVTAAENGKIALACVSSERFDLIITDIIMPEKDGFETIRDIRALQPRAKIIAVSGGGRTKNTEFLRMAKALGATEILAKPFDPDDLVAAVARYVAAV